MLRSPLLWLLSCAFLLMLAAPARADRGFPFKDGERVVLLGDSITYAGGYAQYLEAFLASRFPERRIEVINLGLASETVTGLSEPDHPYPRPNVHTRLARALELKPDWVVACYGMNDGIYHPFSADRLRQYQEGIGKLVEQCRAAGAKVILMTPSAFDVNPVRRAALPLGAPKYSWMRPYEDYDGVLARYAAWLRTLRSPEQTVADPHGIVTSHLAVARGSQRDYLVAGDGVHPNAAGQWLITEALLTEMAAPREADAADLDARRLRVRSGKVTGLTRDGEGLRFRWTSRIPLAFDPAWDAPVKARLALHETLNRYRLRVTGLPAERYALLEGDRRIAVLSRAELEQGVDLLRFPELSTNQNAAALLKAVQERERLLSPAWLTSVGHSRPDTPKGLPLDEAQRRAEPLTRKIRALARPVALDLRLRAE